MGRINVCIDGSEKAMPLAVAVRRLVEQGFDENAIMHTFSQHANRKQIQHAIYASHARYETPRKPRVLKQADIDMRSARFMDFSDPVKFAQQTEYATQLHLIDLKRAGHSPRFTELRIPSDLESCPRLTPGVEVSSYLGSSAAMCADVSRSTGRFW